MRDHTKRVRGEAKSYAERNPSDSETPVVNNEYPPLFPLPEIRAALFQRDVVARVEHEHEGSEVVPS